MHKAVLQLLGLLTLCCRKGYFEVSVPLAITMDDEEKKQCDLSWLLLNSYL